MPPRLFVRLPGDPVYAPETTVPAGTMRELAVPPALRHVVANATFYEERLPPGQEVIEHVLPDGAARVIVDLQDGASIRVVGASAAPAVLRQSGHLRGFSLALQPGAASALLGLPAHALAEQAVSLDEAWGAAGRDLASQLEEANGDDHAATLLLSAFASRAAKSRPDDTAVVRHAVTRIESAGGACTMAALSRATGLGERRLQQLFREQLGLAPRTWMRLARLHHCLRLLRAQRLTWAALAAEAGFSDQAHLANEFRALSGLSPTQFLGVAGSSKTGA